MKVRREEGPEPGQLSGGPSDGDEQARAQEIALLEACFEFPSHFALSVIAQNEEAVAAAVIAAATAEEGEAPVAYERQPSKGGKYISHRLAVKCASAHDAHALRLRLRAIPGVVSVM